ncbi:type II toxin-antitoxin system HicB family antitoxin [Paraburkholderia sp. RL18-103-BIB-C]|uniref:type II toxin-antitoxin system HicB family antitoxin n=1 Tax=Paraburkholderia sp. RL18-103-BIB-C TaxID=3031637 RepID=UPI0038B93EF9
MEIKKAPGDHVVFSATYRIDPNFEPDDGKRERVNISIQTSLVKQADRRAKAAGVTRSAFIAQALREKLQRGL